MQEGGGLGAGSDLVAVWEVHLADGIHVIEFEHGTTSGSRVLRVDREVTSFENWETFRIN